MSGKSDNSPIQPEPGDRVFRQGRSSDQPAVSAVFREANLSFYNPSESGDRAPAEVGTAVVHLCERGGHVVGAIQWRNLGEEAEILDLAVANTHRRQGNARFLLENFLRLVRGHGIREVFLEVRESNHPAIALYEESGFTIAGRRPNYYRNPDEAALSLHLKITG